MWFGEPHLFPERGSLTRLSASGQQSYEGWSCRKFFSLSTSKNSRDIRWNTADRLKKKWIRIQPAHKMLLCTCSNKCTDNFCNYTARYILGVHQSYSLRKKPNTFNYKRINLEFKLEVRNARKLSSTLKERARKAQKRPRGKLRIFQTQTEIHMRRVIRTLTSINSWKSLLHPPERKLRGPLNMTAKRKIVVLAWNYTPIIHFTLQNGAAR